MPIKKQWFDMILSGEKKEEYREITPYYITRFQNIGLIGKDFQPSGVNRLIRLRNGYSSNSPMLEAIVRMLIREGKEDWGAEKNKTYYVLYIQKIIAYSDAEYVINPFSEEKYKAMKLFKSLPCGDCMEFNCDGCKYEQSRTLMIELNNTTP